VSLAVIEQATLPARDSRVNSSVTFRTLILLPLEMSSNRKSIAQMWSGLDAWMWPGARLPRRRRFLRLGTCNPSSHQILRTRLRFTFPSLPAQDRVLFLVAQARVAVGKLVRASAKMLLISSERAAVPLGGAVLTKQDASSCLGGPEAILQAVNRLTSSFGAHQFALATSLSMSMSNAWLATSFFSRAFSFCRFLSTTISSRRPLGTACTNRW
jgi:hypothetical protein